MSLQRAIVPALWVQYEAIAVCQRGPTGDRRPYSPAAHDIRISAEYLRKTANDDVRIWQNLDVGKIADCLIHDEQEVVFVCKRAQSWEISAAQQRIRGKLGENGEGGRGVGVLLSLTFE